MSRLLLASVSFNRDHRFMAMIVIIIAAVCKRYTDEKSTARHHRLQHLCYVCFSFPSALRLVIY